MKRILLVEDNELNRDMLSRRLERRGFAVSIATNGVDGVRAARQLRPDLILMDLGLPDMDGWEATRRIRADQATRSIPVIALSAHVMPQAREEALAAGADDFDSKPVNMERLLAKMEKLIGQTEDTMRR